MYILLCVELITGNTIMVEILKKGQMTHTTLGGLVISHYPQVLKYIEPIDGQPYNIKHLVAMRLIKCNLFVSRETTNNVYLNKNPEHDYKHNYVLWEHIKKNPHMIELAFI